MSTDATFTPTRRGLLGTAAAGTLATGLSAAAPAQARPGRHDDVAPGCWRATGPAQFTVAVMPDTQYLFDDQAIHPEPVVRSLEYLRSIRREQNVVWLAHLGDLTQNGQPQEMAAVRRAFDQVRGLGIGVSTLAGNHDVDGDTDDQRGHTPYLDHFRPRAGAPGLLAASPDGYNSAWTFTAAGTRWMVLALDWRLSDKGFAWAEQVLSSYRMPTILTTHELVGADAGDGVGVVSPYGETLWQRLVDRHDQVFLTLNGHFWPTGRLVRRNAAGHDVHLQLANYQELYYGGAAALRLYHVDVERGVVDVETVVPWAERQGSHQNELARTSLHLTGPADRFSFEVPFAERFASALPAPGLGRRPAARVVGRETVAYWRWDQAGSLAPGAVVRDLSGHGNDLVVVDGGQRLAPVADAHPDQPGGTSLAMGTATNGGDHLCTVASAPLNTATFGSGYTVEAFFRLPATWERHDAWCALLSREGMAQSAGRTQDDKEEPVATLSLSGDRELQWCAYPTSLRRSLTNWGHELPLDRWWHVAVTNDGRLTRMFVDGCELVRNPATVNRGLVTLPGKGWLVGASNYADRLDKVFRGHLGDVRISSRALAPGEFMTAR